MRTWKNRHRQPKKSNRKTRSRKQSGGARITKTVLQDFAGKLRVFGDKTKLTFQQKASLATMDRFLRSTPEDSEEVVLPQEEFEKIRNGLLSAGLIASDHPTDFPDNDELRKRGVNPLQGNPLFKAPPPRAAAPPPPPDLDPAAAAARLAAPPLPPSGIMNPLAAAAPEEPLPEIPAGDTFDERSAASAASLSEIPGSGVQNPLARPAVLPPQPAAAPQANHFVISHGQDHSRTLRDCEDDLRAVRQQLAALTAKSEGENASLAALRDQEAAARSELEKMESSLKPQMASISGQLEELQEESQADKLNLTKLRTILAALHKQLDNKEEDETLSRSVQELIAELETAKTANEGLVREHLAALRAALTQKEADLATRLSDKEKEITDKEREHAETIATLIAQHSAQARELEGRLASTSEKLAGIEGKYASDKEEKDKLTAQATELRALLEAERGRYAQLVAESSATIEALRRELTAATAQVAASQGEARTASQKADAAAEALAGKEGEKAELLEALHLAQQAQVANEEASREAERATGIAQAALAASQADAARLQGELAASGADAGRVQGELVASQATAAALQNQLAASEVAVRAARVEINRLGVAGAALQARLDAMRGAPPVITRVRNVTPGRAPVDIDNVANRPNVGDTLEVIWNVGGDPNPGAWVLVITPEAGGDPLYSQLITAPGPFRFVSNNGGNVHARIYNVIR